jgi:hypothetical protein
MIDYLVFFIALASIIGGGYLTFSGYSKTKTDKMEYSKDTMYGVVLMEFGIISMVIALTIFWMYPSTIPPLKMS